MNFFKIFLLSIIVLILPVTLQAQAAGKKQRIAVLDFIAGSGVDRSEAMLASDLIRTGMVKTGMFTIIDRGNIQTILKEQAFQQSGCIDSECAVQIGRLLAADKILTGKLSRAGFKYIINASIVDIELGKIDFAEHRTLERLDSIADEADDFSQELAERVTGRKKAMFASSGPLGRSDLLWRSALLPGWGHIANEQPLVGLTYFGLFVGSLSGYFAAQKNSEPVPLKKNLHNIMMVLNLRLLDGNYCPYVNNCEQLAVNGIAFSTFFFDESEEISKAKNRSRNFGALAATIYLGQLIHAYFSGYSPDSIADSDRDNGLFFSATPQAIARDSSEDSFRLGYNLSF